MRWVLLALISGGMIVIIEPIEICHQTKLVDTDTCYCERDECHCITEIDTSCEDFKRIDVNCKLPKLSTQYGCLPERSCHADEEIFCDENNVNWNKAACRGFEYNHCECEQNQHPCIIACTPKHYFICNARTVVTEEQTEILVDILGPTFDKGNSSSNIAGELTVNLYYAIIFYPSIKVQSSIEWSNDLRNKYSSSFIESSLFISQDIIAGLQTANNDGFTMSRVGVTQFYCGQDGTNFNFEILFVSNYTLTIKELGGDGVSTYEEEVNHNSSLQQERLQNSLNDKWPNDWNLTFVESF